MSLQQRNNVHLSGSGNATLVFSHGFGCDQSMWKFLLPHFQERFRVVTYDLVGAGQSDLRAYDREKYDSLWGYVNTAVVTATSWPCSAPLSAIGMSARF